MKVTIAVGGRFHAFNLAGELEKRGHLLKLITSYPAYFPGKFGVPKNKVSSILIKEILQRGWEKLPGFLRAIYNPQFLISEIFDRLAADRIGTPDIFTGWSSQSLHSLRRAKSAGAITVVERGSSHIVYQTGILKEEYARFGIPLAPFMVAHPRIIEKELKEYEEADYISVPSLYVKRSFLEQGIPEGKIIHTPYGVDTSAFYPAPKKDGVFRVVFAGGMTLRKGVHYLLQAFAELNLPDAELWLIGAMNPEMEPFFRKYSGSFKYLGHVPQIKLREYYSEASVFVMPSIEEGLALVQPQAMACGLPVIATTNTGGEDIIRNGQDGFIIPIRDVVALKEKILYMYENPEERELMGKSARERVSAGFTWHDYGERIAAAYARISAERHGSF